jgi:hypothetical protein
MKTIAVTFAGRKRYMEILFKYILKYREKIDEYHLYLATTNQDDIDYMVEFQERNSDFVRIVRLETYENFNRTKVWNLCYLNCQDENSLYIKIDDDVVYLDGRLFSEFIEFRKTSKSPLVFPHIINNIISSPILEKHGRIKLPQFDNDSKVYYTWRDTIKRIRSQVNSLKNKMNYDFVVSDLVSQNEILCPVVWGNLGYSLAIHEVFLHKLSEVGVEYLYTENVELDNFEPMSIQCCSWIGKDLKKYTTDFGEVGSEDEPWMSVYLPLWLENPNVIFGESVVSHFSSYNQEPYLLENGILEKYKDLI